MGIVFRQSVKTSLVIFTGAILGTLITWLSTIYIAKQPLGFTRNLATYSIVLSQIFLTGLNSTLIVFIHKYDTKDNRRQLLITLCLSVPLLLAIIATIPFIFFRSWILHHFQPSDMYFMQRYYMLLPIYTLLFILQIMFEQYLGSQMKVAIAAFMREVVLRLFNIILIFLFAFRCISFDFFIIASVLIYAVIILIYLFLAFQTKGFGFSFKLNKFNKEEYKEMVHFSWFHFLLLISITLITFLDTMALPLYDHRGFASVAVYSVALLLISFVQMPNKAMLAPTISVLSQAIAADDHVKTKDIFERSSINVLIATLFMAIIICCNLSNAVALIAKGYEEIIPIFLILFIGRIIDLSTGLNDTILSITKHYKFNFYVSFIMIALLFVLLRIWIPAYGVRGAAWATTITLIIYNVCKYLFVWKKLGMQPFSMKTILVLIAGLPALTAGYFFPHFLSGYNMYGYTLVDVGIRSTIIVIVYVAMLFWLRPSPDLEEYVATVKKNKRLF